MKNFLRRACFSLSFILIIGALTAQPNHAKSKLKVLFVGYDPARPMPESKNGYGFPGGMSKESFIAQYPVGCRHSKSY